MLGRFCWIATAPSDTRSRVPPFGGHGGHLLDIWPRGGAAERVLRCLAALASCVGALGAGPVMHAKRSAGLACVGVFYPALVG